MIKRMTEGSGLRTFSDVYWDYFVATGAIAAALFAGSYLIGTAGTY